MATPQQTVEAYATAWNEPDQGARRRLLERSWADDGTYTDPTAHVEGRAALVEHIAGLHQQMPGARIVLTSRIDEHHGTLRFTWRLLGSDGSIATEGTDFGELASDGRLQQIVGFFGPPPGAA